MVAASNQLPSQARFSSRDGLVVSGILCVSLCWWVNRPFAWNAVEVSSLKQTQTAFSILFRFKRMTWLSCAQHSQTFPEDGYTKPRPARQWVLKNLHCHSSGSFNPNPRHTSQRRASMSRPLYESGHSSAVRHRLQAALAVTSKSPPSLTSGVCYGCFSCLLYDSFSFLHLIANILYLTC